MLTRLACVMVLSGGALAAGLGEPVRIVYEVPDGWTLEALRPDTSWAVLDQQDGSITLVPLALDTLALPTLTAWSGQDTLAVRPPLLVVTRTMPDTVYTVGVFPSPAPMQIPPGLPEDYLAAHRFWLLWMEPGRNLLIPILASVGAAAIITAVIVTIRKKRRKAVPEAEHVEAGPELPGQMLALIESRAMASGDWRVLFGEVDRLLRILVGTRFGIDTHALTYRQMGAEMHNRPDWKRFADDFGTVIREITLQRYAGWGTTRGSATALITSMAESAEKWLT